MSSAVRLIGAAWLALTCHTIKPIEKTMPTAAAIHALVVEFKITFLSGIYSPAIFRFARANSAV
jgi:hypothetical protein